MAIRLLSAVTVNRIAAGEVIERPASVVKELVENSIDSGATRIDITIHDGGRNYIAVSDNGGGIPKEELSIAVERHATSKLSDDNNLLNITHLGFRGEALPSIGSVSRMKITSKHALSQEGWSIEVVGGEKQEPYPATLNHGTKIEVRDLFYATPVRLKFLKTERTEVQHIIDMVGRLAMINPHIGFSLHTEKKQCLSLDAVETWKERVEQLMEADFIRNSTYFEQEFEQLSIKGFAGLPTYHRSSAAAQYVFVNGRPIRDKFIIGAIRSAYQDFLARERYPAVILCITINMEDIDVNVHPTKAEVRFRNTSQVRGKLVNSLKQAIHTVGQRTATTNTDKILETATAEAGYQQTSMPSKATHSAPSIARAPSSSYNFQANQGFDASKALHSPPSKAEEPVFEYIASMMQKKKANNGDNQEDLLPKQAPYAPAGRMDTTSSLEADRQKQEALIERYPMGAARAQLHENYIISETKEGFRITDQHAVHERILYEQMKLQYKEKGLQSQMLLLPEVVDLDGEAFDLLMAHQPNLQQFGIILEPLGDRAITVRELPALLQCTDVHQLIRDMVDELKEYGDSLSLQERFEDILGTIACHHSIRSGRRMSLVEMNALLRQMEEIHHTGQCNHGRPTYVTLTLKEIEKLFGRC